MPSVWGAVAKATNTLSIIGKALVHGVVNGAVTAARGGRFLAGFVSGVIGKVAGFASQSLFGPAGSDNGMFFARTAIAAAGGCAGAVIAKGSCANGAITAAFAHMYNFESSAIRNAAMPRRGGLIWDPCGSKGIYLLVCGGGRGSTIQKGNTLKPGPYAKESIPGHQGRPTAKEQGQVNKLMKQNGCHTCGS